VCQCHIWIVTKIPLVKAQIEPEGTYFLSTSSLFINRAQPHLQCLWRMWVECLLSVFKENFQWKPTYKVPLTIQRSYPTLTSLVANMGWLQNMNFSEIPFKGRRYNLKRRFALHVKCAQLFLTHNKTYRFSRECVCSVRYFLGENSSNRDWDTAEKIQLSAGKVPLVIKRAKS